MIPQEVIMRYKSVKGSSDHVDVDWIQINTNPRVNNNIYSSYYVCAIVTSSGQNMQSVRGKVLANHSKMTYFWRTESDH